MRPFVVILLLVASGTTIAFFGRGTNQTVDLAATRELQLLAEVNPHILASVLGDSRIANSKLVLTVFEPVAITDPDALYTLRVQGESWIEVWTYRNDGEFEAFLLDCRALDNVEEIPSYNAGVDLSK